MSQHLSHEEFAQCFVGSESLEAQRHLRECPECSAELQCFGETVASLRGAIRGRVSARVATHSEVVLQRADRPVTSAGPRWRWAAAAAAIVLFGWIPVVTLETRLRESVPDPTYQSDAAALMDSINLHLSRDLPAPLEPMMVISTGSFEIRSGGNQ